MHINEWERLKGGQCKTEWKSMSKFCYNICVAVGYICITNYTYYDYKLINSIIMQWKNISVFTFISMCGCPLSLYPPRYLLGCPAVVI